MFVKLCRYRVQPALRDRYLAIQEQAARIYQLYELEPATHFQSRHDPHTWIEIHRFATAEACRAATDRLNRDPKILALWQAFQATLDPGVPPEIEEFDQHAWNGHAAPAEVRPAPAAEARPALPVENRPAPGEVEGT